MTLALRNIPDDLYARLETAARAKQRSVDQEALRALEKGLERLEVLEQAPHDIPVFAGDFWELRSIEQLAEMQQVRTASSPDDLAGDWPEEDSLDEFLASIQEARR